MVFARSKMKWCLSFEVDKGYSTDGGVFADQILNHGYRSLLACHVKRCCFVWFLSIVQNEQEQKMFGKTQKAVIQWAMMTVFAIHKLTQTVLTNKPNIMAWLAKYVTSEPSLLFCICVQHTKRDNSESTQGAQVSSWATVQNSD